MALNTKIIGASPKPLICAPLVGNTKEMIPAELAKVLVKKPDVVEWRADFFENIADTAEVIDVARGIKKQAGDISVIFTIRSVREGGKAIALPDQEAVRLNADVCKLTDIEYVDCELSNRPADIRYIKEVAAENGTRVIGSFHDFRFTPAEDVLMQKFREAEAYRLDVAKVAVMPRKLEDVLTLLGVSLRAKDQIKIPLIVVSMGHYGAVSRIIGGVFGSALTFAVGDKSSAPGQVPIEDMQVVLDIIERAQGGLL